MQTDARNEQLSTSDIQGRRLWVYPSDVSGKYRKRRTFLNLVLLLLFLVTPWIKINGSQMLLLNFFKGHISVFGIDFRPHDAPMLLFVFGGAAVLLAVITSLFGRIWCGWACPQTVFIDAVFRRIERTIEGNSLNRRRLDQATWTQEKFLKKSLKWFLYVLAALIIGHSFLAYFIGTESLAHMMSRPPSENLGNFTAMALITGFILFDFGWFREQFCTLLCPYGRFQSVLMDDRSLTIAYDLKRTKDCIDCRRCVQVCPTGIDIRKGLQLECIACTACIDACDTVMKKIGKPLELIRYTSGSKKTWNAFARPSAYGTVLLVLMGSLAWTLQHRKIVEISLVRFVGSPYEEVERVGLEKEIVNHFKLDLHNQGFDSAVVSFTENAELERNQIKIVSPLMPAELKPGETRKVDFFVRFPVSKILDGKKNILLEVVIHTEKSKKEIHNDLEVPLVGPLH